MTQEISALMDGEVDTADVANIVNACHQNEAHKDAWRCYHLIGEALRAEHEHRPGLEQRILAQLQSEPTVLAPKRRTWVPAMPRIAIAAAASVATISAVAWLTLQQASSPPPQVVKANLPTLLQPAPNMRVDDFVLAHREFTAAPDALRPASFENTEGAPR